MSRPPGSRMRRVNELLREIIAEEVTELTDPRIGFLTITGVDTSPDLRSAVVFYTVLGTEEEQRESHEALNHAAPHIQEAVGRQARLKYTPRLAFEPDEAVERGLRIHRLLHDLESDEDTP